MYKQQEYKPIPVEIEQGFASLPKTEVIQVVQKWLSEVKSIISKMQKNNNNEDQKTIIERDQQISIDIIKNLSEVMWQKNSPYFGEDREYRIQTLHEAIERYDKTSADRCFIKDVLLGILTVAADCENIILGNNPHHPSSSQQNNVVQTATSTNVANCCCVSSDSASATAMNTTSSSSASASTNSSSNSNSKKNALLMQGGPSHVSFTKLQCYCIMSCSFLSIFPREGNGNCTDLTGQLPSINLDEMYEGGEGGGSPGKLLMFFDYYRECSKRCSDRKEIDPRMTSTDFAVVVVRGMDKNEKLPDTAFQQDELFSSTAQKPLVPLEVLKLKESIDDQRRSIRVDFANMIVGGASLSFGCVQEEIMFSECPEMQVARWINPVMKDNEAIAILRAERFSEHVGYAYTLDYKQPHHDSDEDILHSVVVAVDAMDFRFLNASLQYEASSILREHLKLRAAMEALEIAKTVVTNIPFADMSIATGNFGAGAFRGDAVMKSIIQWWTFSQFGAKSITYCPFDRQDVLDYLVQISTWNQQQQNKITIGQVTDFLSKVPQQNFMGGKDEVYKNFVKHFGVVRPKGG